MSYVSESVCVDLDTLAVSGKPKRQLRISVSYQLVSVFVSCVFRVCVCVRICATMVRTCLESSVPEYTYLNVCDNMIQTMSTFGRVNV